MPAPTTITILDALREATVTMLAAIATMLCALAIDAEPGPAILAVVLCLSLSRSQLDRDRRGRIEAAVVLPLVGLLTVGVGLLLQRSPWIGALAFTTALSASIWLRRYGPMAARAGTLIALPFVTILVTPYVPTAHPGRPMTMLVPVIVAMIALASVATFHALARFAGVLPPPRKSGNPAPVGNREGALRPDATTRLAIQMASALGVSFTVGYLFFPQRWSWIVLTAFIVSSGNRGRLDVAYKSVLRVIGAAAGTVAALVFAQRLGGHDVATVSLILAAVFFGTWLRPLGYAWWALFATLALALLQNFAGADTRHILWPRLEEIVIGAIIGVAAAWFVLPLRSTSVLRRRIADALAALSDAFDPSKSERRADDFAAALDRVEQVAPAFRASRLVTAPFRATQPADWIDALAACRAPAIALVSASATPGAVRRAVGAARKALHEPRELAATLNDLQRTLAVNSGDEGR